MKQWYVNELSKLSRVSVRTLHHYDSIGLLKPSLRQSNSYRLYSEKDLLKLQQIIALKFFGFKLSQIKILLQDNDDMFKNFSLQAEFLQKKAEALLEATSILKHITAECGNKKSIPWKHIIELIEVYHMTQQLEHAWVKEIFNKTELEQYAKFRADVKARSSVEDKARFEKKWLNLIDEFNNHLNMDPTSKKGIELSKKCMDLINGLYGKENINLRMKIFENGFCEGKGLEEHHLTPEIVKWLEKATNAYYQQCAYEVLDQIDSLSPSVLLSRWNDLLNEMYGNDAKRKQNVINTALNDIRVSQKAKTWLKNTFN